MIGAIYDSTVLIIVWGEVMRVCTDCSSNLIRGSDVSGQLSFFFLASLLKCISDLKNPCAV